MVLCARDMSSGAELMQAELFSGDEQECPGYDACQIAMCGVVGCIRASPG